MIIISAVRSNFEGTVGFLNDFRRMNVAITRARKLVMLVGDSQTLNRDPFLKEILKYFKTNGDVRLVKAKYCNNPVLNKLKDHSSKQQNTNS